MTLIWNLPLNFDVAFCNWLDKFLPPTHSFPFYQLFSIHVTSQFSLVLFLFEFLYLKFFPLAELSRVFLWSLLKDRWVYSLSLDVLASDYHLCNLVWAGAALDILAPKARTKNICICVCLCVCMCMFMFMCMCMCVYIYVYVFFVCVYVYVWVCMCMFIFITLNINTQTHKHTWIQTQTNIHKNKQV